jgi:Kae1-associated kinase Bud32
MPGRVIARGAEAVLYLENQKVLVKERIKKGYRIPALDEKIRFSRTRREAKLLSRAGGSGVTVPKVVGLGNSEIRMDYIDGRTVKDSFNSLTERQRSDVCGEIGEMTAMLHRNGMVHGDLTTSNMIIMDGRLYLVDFGLGKFSQKIEDQAVDLFLLYEALKAAHYKYLNKSWQKILKIYRQNYSNAGDVLGRFEKISLRRRYK